MSELGIVYEKNISETDGVEAISAAIRTSLLVVGPRGRVTLDLSRRSASDLLHALDARPAEVVRVVTVEREAIPTAWWVLLLGVAALQAAEAVAAYLSGLIVAVLQ